MKLLLPVALIAIVAPAFARGGADTITATGWFSDEKCATARVAGGRIGPTGRACTRECLAKGVPMVFIDEKEKAVLRVDNPRIVRGREGDHVQIEAVRKDAKTLHVTSVRVLEKYAAKRSEEHTSELQSPPRSRERDLRRRRIDATSPHFAFAAWAAVSMIAATALG